MLVSLWTCSLSIMNVRTLESRCCLPAGYQRKTHKWKRASEPRMLWKPAASAAEAERNKQVRCPGRRLHGFYLSGYGKCNIFQHLRGCGELLLTHLVSWFNARLNTPFIDHAWNESNPSKFISKINLTIPTWHQFYCAQPGLKLDEGKGTFTIGDDVPEPPPGRVHVFLPCLLIFNYRLWSILHCRFLLLLLGFASHQFMQNSV